MALVVYDRVQETTATSGTGSLILGGAVSGFQSFAIVGNGNTTFYTIINGSQWEVGLGTYSTTGPTLARTTIYSNSNGNTSPITLSGSSNVFVTYPAEKSINYDANGVATIGSTLNYTDTGIIASFASTVAGYNQVIYQNLSSATNASTNINVSNNSATATTGYAEMGINSTTFSNGAGAFNIPGAAYFASASTDLAIGTYGAYNIHFATNGNSNTTDAMTIYNSGGTSLGGLGDPGIGNIAINNAVVGFTAITSSSTAVSLVSSSTQVQAVVGSVAQRINLPQATTLLKGTFYTISNASSANVTVYDNAGTLLETVTPGGAAQFLCTSNSTSAGTWGIRVFAASNVQWGTTALNYTGNITGATWNGSTIGTGYGGTGLTTFTSANQALYSTSSSALAAGTLPVAAGGTGITTTPTNGQLLIGNGTNYTVASLGTSTGISTTTGAGTLTINNTGVTSAVAGTGISVSGATGAVTITNSSPMTYPGAGIPNSTGSAWGTSYSTTGSGSVVLSTSPTLTTPNLGTPSAVVLTNATSVPVNQATGTLAVSNGGTGLTTTPTNGQLDIGNGSGFTRATLTQGTGIGIVNGTGSITISNSGVTSLTTSSGLSTNTNATGSVSITNTGVTSAVAGTGINVSGSTGAVTISNSGVTSITGTTSQISASASTGGVTLSLTNPINVNTTGNASNVTGVVAVANGGTGLSSPGTSGNVLTSNGTSWVSSAPAGSTLTTTDFTATSGQTTFSITYTPSLLLGVYRNGVKLGQADYTATNGTSVVLATGAVTGDLIQIQTLSAVASSSSGAGGSNTQIQYNSSGSLAGASTLTYNGTYLLSNSGLVPGELFYQLSSGYTGSATTNAQPFLGVGITLSGSTIYQFEGVLSISKTSSATAHNIQVGFGGTATLNNISYAVMKQNGSATSFTDLNNSSAYLIFPQTASATTVTTPGATAAIYQTIIIKGIVSVNAGGTFIPQYTTSASVGPYTTAVGSYFKLSPIGAAGSNINIGGWA